MGSGSKTYTTPASGAVTSTGVCNDGTSSSVCSDGILKVTFITPVSANNYATALAAAKGLISSSATLTTNTQRALDAAGIKRRAFPSAPSFHRFSSPHVSPPSASACASMSSSSALYQQYCDDSNGLSDADIAGIIIGSVVGFVILLAIVYFLFANKKHTPTDEKQVTHNPHTNHENVVPAKATVK